MKRFAIASLALVATCSFANADNSVWPTKPITLVVPFPPGGGTDIVARAIGQKLAARLSTPVIVDNKPGAATTIGAEVVARSAPDGYTLFISGASTFSINPAMRTKLRYDSLQDFTPIGIVAKVPLFMTVNAASPYKTVHDVIAQSRTKPASINYATYGVASAPHLAGELFSLAAGIKMTDVGYRGSSPAIMGLLSGEIEVALDTAAVTGPQVRAGKLRAIANFSSTRSSDFPDVPTMAELKLPEANFEGWYGIAAPSRTPEAVVQRLAQEVKAVMGDPEVQAQLRAQSIEPVSIGGAAMRAQIESEITRYRALAHRARIQLD